MINLTSKFLLVVALAFAVAGCGGADPSTAAPAPPTTGPGGGTGGGGGGGTSSVTVSVAAGSASLIANGTSTTTITATVTDAGVPVADGTVVNFSRTPTTGGTLSAASATTVGGNASVTFTAGTTVTTVTVNATYGTATGAATITLTAVPPGGMQTVSVVSGSTSLVANGTSATTLTATVTDGVGAPVADGTVVNFSRTPTTGGTLSAASATTVGGNASVTFTAGTTTTTVTISATSGAATGAVSITLTSVPPPPGGIQFVSARPDVIGIQGGGQPTTSTITFKVTDASGNPVAAGQSVAFAMTGPSGGKLPSNGGEFIGSDPTNPTVATGTTDGSGLATVILNSGSVPGPVTIKATVVVGTTTFSSSSSVISIGGGVPSAKHFSFPVARKNLPGLVLDNFPTTATVLLADRSGNFNVLAGTSVSFYAEAGAIDTSAVVDNTGKATVNFRTQAPLPAVLGPAPYQPNGWVTILATVRGEETFIDANGNGKFDVGESFSDLGEPFIDQNDDEIFNVGEYYVDGNGNSAYDGPNGMWDGPMCPSTGCQASPMIWAQNKLMFTGNCTYAIFSVTNGFVVPNNSVLPITVRVGDQENNRLVPGTVISISKSGAGTLVGQTSFTVPDGIGGPSTYTVTLQDQVVDTTAAVAPSAVTLTMNISPGNSEVVSCTDTVLYGTVDTDP
jgi:hypothetical protein